MIRLALFVLSLSFQTALAQLAPPPGAVADTDRFGPRIELSQQTTPGNVDAVYRITQPGSYVLGHNVTAAVAQSGIEITTGDVTLDLGGHRVRGVANSLNGVLVQSQANGVRVHNGTIRGFGSGGLIASSSENVIVRDINVEQCLNGGIRLGVASIAERCTAQNNSGNGFSGQIGVAFASCTAYQNSGNGFAAGLSATVRGCTASFNTLTGIDGGVGSTIVDSTAFENDLYGLNAGSTSTITGCATWLNSVHGIVALASVVVKDNSSTTNGGDGLRASQNCLIKDNVFSGNVNGISIGGQNNRIEGNNCVLNSGAGIEVTIAGNLIIRNSASNNGANYSIARDNTVGPIVTMSNIDSDMSPHANYEF